MPGRHFGDSETFQHLASMYGKDIDQDHAKAQYDKFCIFYKNTPEINENPPKSVSEMLQLINKWDINNAYPVLTTLYRILGTIAVSSATSKRSFSRLKLTKLI